MLNAALFAIDSATFVPAARKAVAATKAAPPVATLARRRGSSCIISSTIYLVAKTPLSALKASQTAVVVFQALSNVERGVPSGLVFSFPFSSLFASPIVLLILSSAALNSGVRKSSLSAIRSRACFPRGVDAGLMPAIITKPLKDCKSSPPAARIIAVVP